MQPGSNRRAHFHARCAACKKGRLLLRAKRCSDRHHEHDRNRNDEHGSGHYRPTADNLVRCLKALKDQASPLYFHSILVRNHAGPNPIAVYLAGKYLITRGHCLPVGYYESASGCTHYKKDFVEFSGPGEIPAFLESQDSARALAKVANELKALTAKLELAKIKNQLSSGKPNNDGERRIIRAALQMGGGGGREMLLRYYVNDQPMLDWEKRR
jgi:hypothetical protein